MPSSSPINAPHSMAPPTDDPRWRLVDTTMRHYGYAPNALIETLRIVQESFGYLDAIAMKYIARSLRMPLSKVYGVVTFYGLFRLKPPGEHTCTVCLGTACYIKGAKNLLDAVKLCTGLLLGQTSADNKISLLSCRCFGACGIAPAAILDGQVIGNLNSSEMEKHIRKWTVSK